MGGRLKYVGPTSRLLLSVGGVKRCIGAAYVTSSTRNDVRAPIQPLTPAEAQHQAARRVEALVAATHEFGTDKDLLTDRIEDPELQAREVSEQAKSDAKRVRVRAGNYQALERGNLLCHVRNLELSQQDGGAHSLAGVHRRRLGCRREYLAV